MFHSTLYDCLIDKGLADELLALRPQYLEADLRREPTTLPKYQLLWQFYIKDGQPLRAPKCLLFWQSPQKYLEDIQRTKDTARASSTEKQEDVTQLDRSCSHPVLGDPEPWKVHASKITCEGGHGRGTLDNDQGIPLVEDDPLGLCFKFYAHDLPAILEATFVPRSLVEIHFALLDPDGYHDGVDDANYPIRKCFPTSCNLHLNVELTDALS
ncbi:hypothetical protein OG21DRAFT_1488437 [Imleria badia]|nr:hypothetical protein OG21DRAFT_1488437 [Imleria badia]